MKSPKGHRLYRREDVQTVLHIKRLLYDEGFTIAGARRHLRESDTVVADSGAANGEEGGLAEPTLRFESEDSPEPASKPQRPNGPSIDRQALVELRDELRAFLTLLESE